MAVLYSESHSHAIFAVCVCLQIAWVNDGSATKIIYFLSTQIIGGLK